MLHTLDVEQETGFQNWRCMPNPEEAPAPPPGPCPVTPDNTAAPVCVYMLRAKRLTHDPQHVELVWFDGKELDNPTYALYVAAHATDDRTAVTQLCAYQYVTPPVAPYDVRYTGTSMGSATAPAP